MAFITLAGTLRDPTSELAVGDQIRFTHKSTTGETVEGAVSVLTIDPSGTYSKDLQYGLVLVEYKDVRTSQFKNLGVATVNGSNPATSIPELLNALVPVSSAELIEFQAILADAVTARNEAEAFANSIDLINDLSQAYIFPTVAAFKASLIVFPDSKRVETIDNNSTSSGGGACYTVAASQVTDGYSDHTLNDGRSAIMVTTNTISAASIGISTTGELSDLALQAAVSKYQGKVIDFPSGSYNFSVFPASIDGVRFSGVNGAVSFSDVKMPMYSGVITGGLETILVNGVIRYYPAGAGGSLAGWWLLKNQGQDHDPIMLSQVQAGAQQNGIRIDTLVSAFGLDPALWTPSGLVVGPDETLAKEGMTFGASVGTDNILIQGSYNTPANIRLAYSVGSGDWVRSGSAGSNAAAYTYVWTDGGTGQARLRVTRTSGGRLANPGSYNGSQFIVTAGVFDKDFTMTPYSILTTQTAIDGNSNTFIDIMFFSLVDGSRIQTESSDMRLFLVDHQARNTEVRFNTFDDYYGNIWISGAFVKKP